MPGPRLQSLASSEQFSRVLRTGRVSRGGIFQVYVLPGEHGRTRLGIVVPKRLVRKAVWRNGCRRQVRELCRTMLQQLGGWEIVVRVQRSCTPGAVRAARRELAEQLYRSTHVKDLDCAD